MRLFSALAHRSFALLYTGRAISALGDGTFLVALAWYVLQTTYSAAANGVILICAAIPQIGLSLVGGIAADWLPRRGLLLVSDVARVFVVGIIAVLAWLHLLAFWHLAALSALFGIEALGSFALTPLGYGLAGVAADALGAAPVFVLGGAVSACIIALGLLHPQVRRLD